MERIENEQLRSNGIAFLCKILLFELEWADVEMSNEVVCFGEMKNRKINNRLCARYVWLFFISDWDWAIENIALLEESKREIQYSVHVRLTRC